MKCSAYAYIWNYDNFVSFLFAWEEVIFQFMHTRLRVILCVRIEKIYVAAAVISIPPLIAKSMFFFIIVAINFVKNYEIIVRR